MIEGIKSDRTWDYTIEKDKDNPTIWKLGSIDSTTLMCMTQDAKSGEFMTFLIKVVRIGLKGWKNFKIDGKDVPFKTVKEEIYGKEREVIDLESLNRIPADVITELGTVIIEKNKLSDDEQKN